MQFGSVAFFKMLIKIVLCIVFFVPLVLCVVFAVLLWNSNAKADELAKSNEELAKNNERLEYYLEYYSGMMNGESEPTVEGFYSIYSKSGLSDEALVEFILNGKDNSVPAVKPVTEESSVPEKQTQEAQTSSEPPKPESKYADIYPDMVVNAPAEEEYVREIGTVYLTFDDGPSDNTYSILSYLEQYNIKATFFVVPTRTETCYARLKAIADAGHTIGVHSATHVYEEIYSSVEAYLEDFHEAWDIIYDATGIKTELFRFPGGSVNDFNVETRDYIIQEMTRRGFRFFDWNVDSNDAGGANWTEMYNSIPADIAANYRSVVLMHDSANRPNTVLVLGDVLQVLVNEGYKFDKINNNTKPVQFTGPFA